MNVYDFTVKNIRGEEVKMSSFKGKTLLIVNVASKCGFTPQYKGLENLYKKYKSQGLEILGFPCNQFGSQEPGQEKEIVQFCELNFGVTFPLFQKIDVNGKNADPLYEHLKEEAPGILGSKAVKWNFTKFLVDAQGNVKVRFAPNDEPEKLEEKISPYLGKKQ